MILKDRPYPIILLKLAAIIRRLPKTHPKQSILQAEFNKRSAGYWGEKRLDEFIDGILHFPFIILRDLSLTVRGVHLQIDTLILSPYFILILESKNISGILLFDTSYNQLIRTIDGKEEGFEDPILQVQNQKRNLTNWLLDQKITPPPIETLVVMSNPSSIIKSTSGNKTLSQIVIPVKKIVNKIEEISRAYQKEIYSEKEVKKIGKLLIKHHQPKDVDILQKYNISQNEILNGVICPSCAAFPMVYQKGKWTCPICKTKSIHAYHSAVDDYLLIIKNTITNHEFRSFIQIPSINVASKMLIKMGLPYKGAKKNREYYKR